LAADAKPGATGIAETVMRISTLCSRL